MKCENLRVGEWVEWMGQPMPSINPNSYIHVRQDHVNKVFRADQIIWENTFGKVCLVMDVCDCECAAASERGAMLSAIHDLQDALEYVKDRNGYRRNFGQMDTEIQGVVKGALRRTAKFHKRVAK